jgi:hypothetical protein
MTHLLNYGARALSSPPTHVGGEVARAKPVTERGTMVQNVALPVVTRPATNLLAPYLKLHHCPPLRHGLRPRHLSPIIRWGRGQRRRELSKGLPCS